MNTSLLFVVILMCVRCGFAQVNDVDPKECLKDENQNRRGYAKMNKIGNMVKLEYDKSMELNPIEGFECPNQLQAQKYKEGVWAFSKTGDGTSDSPLASKFACVQHEKCGFLLLINKGPKHADQAKGKEAGTACSGKVDDGLCDQSVASVKSAPPRSPVTESSVDSTPVASNASTWPHASLQLFFISSIMIILSYL
ncbi:hypothetical protein CRE_24656 [Caenorhabditis remanei]|uniref:Uncharacterized protein n=1 Tax=Caenorhabditis remanei TaxID=31234 RepID=E3N3X8_CAERE|nr:hypothetical protein CRE_24656 [Caenorhabditis remanei]